MYQVSFGLLRFLSVPPFNFLFVSSTSTIALRCFSTTVSSLLLLLSTYYLLFESVSASSTSLCRSSILVRARLRKNTICTPSFSLSSSSHLHQINPPTSNNRPRSSQGHRLVPLLCYSAKPHARNISTAPLRKLAAFVRVAVNRFLEISDVGVSTATSHPSPKAFVWTPLSDQTQTRAPLSPCAHPCYNLSSGLSTRPVGPLSCQTLGGTDTYCHRPPTLHLDRPTSVQRSS